MLPLLVHRFLDPLSPPYTISQNILVTEIFNGGMMKSDRDLLENVHDFVDQISNTKSHIQRCIKILIKETNKHKLDYGQLRYIFRRVREECGVEVKETKNSLYELPNREQMNLFYSVIHNPIHKLMFEFLEGTGLRVSELCKLEICRINFDENLIFIKEGKGKKR